MWSVEKLSNDKGMVSFLVEDDWLDSIPRDGIVRLELLARGDKLEVEYKNGRTIYYEDIHGTWGSPVEFV